MTHLATPTPASTAVFLDLDAAAEYVMTRLSKREPGPYEVLLEPYEDGHLPTSTGLEDAIRRRAAGMVPPVVVRGLSAGVKGYRGDDVLMVVEGAI